MVKVSIVIPVWNTGEAACLLISSLLKQFKDIEVIAVDDGSTDDSLVRLKKLARKDARLKLLEQENRGAAAARNAGINISRGEYLMFADSDDEVSPEFVVNMVGALDENSDAALAVCGMTYHRLSDGSRKAVYSSPLRGGHKGEKVADYILYLLCVDGRIYSSVNKIYRAEVVKKAKLHFEEGRKFAEDSKFVLDYLAAAGRKKYSPGDIIFVNEPLYIYNYGTETSTVKTEAAEWGNWQRQYEDTLSWARKMSGGRLGLKTLGLLNLLKLRWRISYHKAKRRLAKEAGSNQTGGRAGKFVIVGLVITAFDFLISTVFTRVIFHDNNMQAVATIIATAMATILAYILHSRITWKERKPSRHGVLMFFLWNALMAFLLRPGVTWLLGLLTGLYEFAFGIIQAMHLPLGYDTVEYLGIYALLSVVTLLANYFFYDRLVFGKKTT